MDDATPAPAERHRARSIVVDRARCPHRAGPRRLRRGGVGQGHGAAGTSWRRSSATRSTSRRCRPALADRITDEVFTAVDVQNRITAALPDQLQRFAPTIAAGAEQAVERAADRRARQRARCNDMVETIVERAHELAHPAARGRRPVARRSRRGRRRHAQPAAADRRRPRRGAETIGLLSDVTLPDLDAGGDPQQQIAELSAAHQPAAARPTSVSSSSTRASRWPTPRANLQMAQRIARPRPAGRVAAGHPVGRARRGDDPRRRPSLAGRAGARHRHGRGDGAAALGDPRGRRPRPRPRQQAGSEGGDRRVILDGVSDEPAARRRGDAARRADRCRGRRSCAAGSGAATSSRRRPSRSVWRSSRPSAEHLVDCSSGWSSASPCRSSPTGSCRHRRRRPARPAAVRRPPDRMPKFTSRLGRGRRCTGLCSNAAGRSHNFAPC